MSSTFVSMGQPKLAVNGEIGSHRENLQWVPVSRRAPCPLCEKADWCSVLLD